MVKGISKQVIVVDAPETKLFEQAIFILRDGSPAVTDEYLLKEADKLLRTGTAGCRKRKPFLGPFWAMGGASVMAIVWLLTAIC